MKTFIIGISGGSGSGKSSFVKDLASKIGQDVTILAIDHYYKDLSHLSPKARDQCNFDHPDAIEWPLLIEQLGNLRQGQTIFRPNYDFATHERRGNTTVNPSSVIIVDGIFAMSHEALIQLLDMRLFVECDADIRLARRILRDSQSRGRSTPQVLDQYLGTVKSMHAQFIEPLKFKADFIIPWHDRNPRAVAMLSDLIDFSLRQA